MRALFQVLVIPFRVTTRDREYALLRRRVERYWQCVAGGGKDDEAPPTSARRELAEELGSPEVLKWWPLDLVEYIPSADLDFQGRHIVPGVVPEYAFAAELDPAATLALWYEHAELAWVPYEVAVRMLHWSSNVRALDELEQRLNDRTKLHPPIVHQGRCAGRMERVDPVDPVPPDWHATPINPRDQPLKNRVDAVE